MLSKFIGTSRNLEFWALDFKIGVGVELIEKFGRVVSYQTTSAETVLFNILPDGLCHFANT